MSDFVEIQHADGSIDFVNLDQVARVEAVGITNEDWVVKVLLANGTEVVDIRAKSKDEAAKRVDTILGRTAPPPA